MAERVTWGTIEDQTITFPMNVDDFNAATMGFSVPAAAAAALLPGDGFEIIEIGPGVAQFIISLCDYRDNPWGDYNEVNLGFLARPAGAGDDVIGSFIYRMPVDQQFTCEAGNLVMGFPKVVTRIDADYTDAQVTFQLLDGGELAAFDQRGEDRPVLTALIAAREEGVLSIEGDGAHRPLDGVGVQFEVAVA